MEFAVNQQRLSDEKIHGEKKTTQYAGASFQSDQFDCVLPWGSSREPTSTANATEMQIPATSLPLPPSLK